jgi:hypothetical protein
MLFSIGIQTKWETTIMNMKVMLSENDARRCVVMDMKMMLPLTPFFEQMTKGYNFT